MYLDAIRVLFTSETESMKPDKKTNGSCHIKWISICENGKFVLYHIFILFVFVICKKFFFLSSFIIYTLYIILLYFHCNAYMGRQ